MQNPRNLSWAASNRVRKFPLSDDASGMSSDGRFAIPDDFLIGLYINTVITETITDPSRFYISKLVWSGTSVLLEISYPSAIGATVVARTSAVYDETNETVNAASALTPVEQHVLTGTVVYGTWDSMKDMPPGEWIFSEDGSRIDPFCVRPILRAPSSLYVRDGENTFGPYYGRVILEAGTNIRLSATSLDPDLSCLEPPPPGYTTAITISGSCPEDEESGAIRRINGVPGDALGNVQLIGKGCLTITPDIPNFSLELDDTCAEPCCTCAELVPIQAAADSLRDTILLLETRINTLTLQAEFLTTAQAFI